jgi:hypothetical protein
MGEIDHATKALDALHRYGGKRLAAPALMALVSLILIAAAHRFAPDDWRNWCIYPPYFLFISSIASCAIGVLVHVLEGSIIDRKLRADKPRRIKPK